MVTAPDDATLKVTFGDFAPTLVYAPRLGGRLGR